jgi:hypothetical protein
MHPPNYLKFILFSAGSRGCSANSSRIRRLPRPRGSSAAVVARKIEWHGAQDHAAAGSASLEAPFTAASRRRQTTSKQPGSTSIPTWCGARAPAAPWRRPASSLQRPLADYAALVAGDLR